MALEPMKGWLNGSYLLNAVNASCQRSVNLFSEAIESGEEKSVGYRRGFPGLDLPLVTLPTAPLRAAKEVGAPLSGASRMFAVGGSKLYEVFAAFVTVSGTAVASQGGSPFTAAMAGQPVFILGVSYAVQTYNSPTSITLASSAGVQSTPVRAGWYNQRGYSGQVSVTNGSATVNYVSSSGQSFVAAMGNQPILIDNVHCDILSVQSSTQLTLSQPWTGSSGAYAYTTGSDVGNDGYPAQLLPNGNQCAVISSGQYYCDNGVGPYPTQFPSYTYSDLAIGWGNPSVSQPVATPCIAGEFALTQGYSGQVSVTHGSPTVNWASGAQFTTQFAGQNIQIGLVTYTVQTWNSATQFTLTTNYAGGNSSGIDYTTINPATGLSTVPTGAQPFNEGMIGMVVTIFDISTSAEHTGVILAVPDPTQLTLSNTGIGLAAPSAYAVPAGAQMVSSVSAPFAGSDVDATLVVASGVTGFTAGTYTILSVDDFGNVLLGQNGVPAFVGNGTEATGGQAVEEFGQVMARTGAYLDSFFILNPPDSAKLLVSSPLDGTTFDSSEYATKESYPDNVGRLIADHQELCVLGESHSEVWQAPGADPTFPFQPNEAYAMPMGVAAPWSACSLRDGPAWIGSSERGQPIAYFAQGFQPVRISTHAVEQVWAKFSTVFDAQGFVFELEGHEFWVVNFPTADQCWIYDRTASVQFGKSMWYERTSYDGTAFHRFRGACQAFAFGTNWVGDFAASGYGAGNIYELSDQVYTDNGQPITYIITLPHICAGRLRQFFSKLQLDLETGANAITILLEWSDDGGTTWVGGGTYFTYTTQTTTNEDRAVFWQLGSADDRVFRLTITSNALIALIMAYLDSTVGVS